MRPPKLRREIESVVESDWPETCVLFSGKRQPNGYGRVCVDGSYRRAHVYACELAHGARPPDKTDAAHSCGDHMCINPAHLRWATRQENEADKVAHGRHIRGERSGTAILNRAQVVDIRRRYERGGVTQRQLAQFYGVHIMTISDIVNHKTWRHI